MSYMLPDGVFDYLQTGGPHRILELGSGVGTDRLLRAGHGVVSIEHDQEWAKKCRSACLYSPLGVDGWYSVDDLNLRLLTYDVLLIDGPPGDDARARFYDHIGCFPTLECVIVIDDVHRPKTCIAAHLLARDMQRVIEIRTEGSRQWAIIP